MTLFFWYQSKFIHSLIAIDIIIILMAIILRTLIWKKILLSLSRKTICNHLICKPQKWYIQITITLRNHQQYSNNSIINNQFINLSLHWIRNNSISLWKISKLIINTPIIHLNRQANKESVLWVTLRTFMASQLHLKIISNKHFHHKILERDRYQSIKMFQNR